MKTKKIIKYHLSRMLGRPFSHRRYIEKKLGIEGFLGELKRADINYVVLRWFETLPQIEPGEDIDILFADQDIGKLNKLTRPAAKKDDIPCDIYSVSGLPGTNSNSMPYYPIDNARRILANAIWFKDMVRVPAADEHLLSISYHAIYRKGYASGIPSEEPERNKRVTTPQDHNYKNVVETLLGTTSFAATPLEVTLEGMDRFLSHQGWKPDRDSLINMSRKNPWIADALL